MEKTKSPFGVWKSPITSDLIVSRSIKLFDIVLDDEKIYWTESRPTEGGRSVVVCKDKAGVIRDYVAKPFNVRSKVHEYGGLSYAAHGKDFYFCNYKDQKIYSIEEGQKPQPITPEGNFRYADLQIDKKRNRIVCVNENHVEGIPEPINCLINIDPETEEVKIIGQGADFYAFPRISPDGDKLAFICWYHPNMPWDGTELWLATINEEGTLKDPKKIAGGAKESIFQPEFAPNGDLYFVSDKNGFWNLYRYSQDKISPVLEMEAEFGLPLWVFGMSTYDFITENQIICTFSDKGVWKLGLIDLANKKFTLIENEFTSIDYLRAQNGKAVFRGSSPTKPPSIVEFDLSKKEFTILKSSANISVDPEYFSIPQTIEYKNSKNQKVYGFFYPPQNKDYEGLEGEKPPLIVMSHGGPSGATTNSLSLKTQYWSSRGFAVLDVNYGGSTGFGRKYRERLNGNWGVVDVEDCVCGAKFLAEKGLVDPEKLIIRGSSAGGYTTLAALTFYDTFKAGASYYGISDLEVLAGDTHKFESRYTDRLVSKYPEEKRIYESRSPINHTEKLSCPIIFFQGLEDKVVPPNQAEMMVEALRMKGLPVALVTFPDESHGFRKAENIKRALEGELYFYSKIFGFQLSEDVEEVEIFNF